MKNLIPFNSSLALGIFFLTKGVTSLKCGIPSFTKPCIGETDIRYDPKQSFDLQDQDNYFKIIPGLYISHHYRYDAEDSGIPRARTNVPTRGFNRLTYGTWNNFPNLMFHNISVAGSRMTHRTFRFSMHNGDHSVEDLGENITIPGIINVFDSYCEC